jgi:hypothetical protein
MICCEFVLARTALGLAIGARGIGLCAQVTDAVAATQRAVGRGVVGHDPLDPDPEGGEPGERPLQEGGRRGLPLVRQDLAISQAGGVVDRDMGELPAGAARGVAPVAGDAVANALDAAELLHVRWISSPGAWRW